MQEEFIDNTHPYLSSPDAEHTSSGVSPRVCKVRREKPSIANRFYAVTKLLPRCWNVNCEWHSSFKARKIMNTRRNVSFTVHVGGPPKPHIRGSAPQTPRVDRQAAMPTPPNVTSESPARNAPKHLLHDNQSKTPACPFDVPSRDAFFERSQHRAALLNVTIIIAREGD